jgi:hypothetical protein
MTEAWQQFLADRGAVFHDGRVTAFRAPLPLPPAGAAVVDLSHLGIMRVDGSDAAAFLHAQLTNDVLALPDGAWQWNGWCTPKGRLLATFLLWRRGAEYFLMLPRALQGSIQKRLGMFVLRSKVRIVDAGAEAVAIGLVGGEAADRAARALGSAPPEGDRLAFGVQGWTARLSAFHALLMCGNAAAAGVWRGAVDGGAAEAGEAAWRWAGIEAGLLQVDAATQEQFVPQMGNADLTGGLSFKKGCYPGQEIVARTQYRGILKRRMVKVVTRAPLAAGDAVFAAEFGEQPAGQVADAVRLADGGSLALVVAQIESIRAGSLCAADGTILQSCELPYRVPELAGA